MSISLSGLDLSFLQKSDTVEKGRFRWSDKAKKLVTVREWHRLHGESSKRSRKVGRPFFMPDVDAAYGGSWKSIIDGSEISSRSNWREHNKRHEVVDVGDKFWAEDGDDVRYTEEQMGYDPSLIGHPDFVWGKQDLD